MGKAPCANALAQVSDGLRVAEKFLEAHVSSLEHARPRCRAGTRYRDATSMPSERFLAADPQSS
jgi:hypothetical protein